MIVEDSLTRIFLIKDNIVINAIFYRLRKPFPNMMLSCPIYLLIRKWGIMYLVKTENGKVKDMVFFFNKHHAKAFLYGNKDWQSYSNSARLCEPEYKSWTEFDRISSPFPDDMLGWQIKKINLIVDRIGSCHMVELVFISPHKATQWLPIEKFALRAYHFKNIGGCYDDVDFSLDKRNYTGSVRYFILNAIRAHLSK